MEIRFENCTFCNAKPHEVKKQYRICWQVRRGQNDIPDGPAQTASSGNQIGIREVYPAD